MIVFRRNHEAGIFHLEILLRPVSALILAFLVASISFAQPPEDDDTFDPNAAPPPIKLMSGSEREQLETKHDLKERTKLALALMSTRLSKAEEFNAKSQFVEMFNELGGFHALMDDTLEFLESAPRRDKTLDTLKRFEMTLRTFAPRIALIRRELPSEYDHYVRSLLRYLRDARSRAIEPLFGDTVVPNRRNT
ncbi:MAG: hypothetical protein AB7G18_16575 [Pyrinomonadaceae bacterium]